MQISDQLFSAASQVGVVLGISAFVYGIRWLFFRKRFGRKSFFAFIGLKPSLSQLDKQFVLIWLALVGFSVVSAISEFYYSDTFREFLLSDTSPYGKILNSGFGARAIILGLIYCFVQASGSEEILFRGLIA